MRSAERARLSLRQRATQSSETSILGAFWDGSGLWVCAKRLEKGRFRWPETSGEETKVVLSHEELALLLGGIDLADTQRRQWYRRDMTSVINTQISA